MAFVDEGDLYAIGVEGLHRLFLIGPRHLRTGAAFHHPYHPEARAAMLRHFGS